MDFDLLSGTATGGDHIEAATNGQDSFSIRVADGSIVVVVADGCSSQPHSEVGAKMVAPMLATFLEQAIRKGQSLEDQRIWNYLRDLLLAKILSTATDMAGDHPVAPVLNKYFQFTLVGMVMTPQTTVFFSRGDGMFGINGKVTTIEPEAGNRPAYLVYGLTRPDMVIDNPKLLDFDIQAVVPTPDVQSWWVGTDGVKEMLKVVGQSVNGEKIVSIESLFDDQRYLDNPELLCRRLQQLVVDNLIGDDITLVAGQRIPLPDDTPEVTAEETGEEVIEESSPAPEDTVSIEEKDDPGKGQAAPAAGEPGSSTTSSEKLESETGGDQ